MLFGNVMLLLFGIAALAWVLAILAAFWMVPHRKQGVTIGWLMMHGIAFYTGEGFSGAAEPYRRLLVSASLAFGGAIGLGLFIGYFAMALP